MLGSLMELVGAVLGITLSITLPHLIVLLVRYQVFVDQWGIACGVAMNNKYEGGLFDLGHL